MDTSRSQDRSMTPRNRRRGGDGTRGSREPLGTLGFKLKQQVLIVVIIVKVNIATIYYIPRYHTTATHATTFFCIAYSPADETYEIPELPFQNSKQGNDAEEDEEEDHTYEPLPLTHPNNEYICRLNSPCSKGLSMLSVM